MKLIKPILLLLAALALPAQADWLIISGEAGNARSDYSQFRTESLRVECHLRFVGVRASQVEPHVGDGLSYRSFDAWAVVDCDQDTARYLSTKYFEKAKFEGLLEAMTYTELNPVVCWLTAAGCPVILIKAACSIGKVTVATGLGVA